MEESHWLDAALSSSTSAPVGVRAYALTIRAQVAYDLGDFERANLLAGQSLNLYRSLENPRGSINALRGLGTIARARGQPAEAQRWYEKSLSLATQTSDDRLVSYALKSLGDLKRELGALDDAKSLLERSASLAREAGDRFIQTYILHGAGDVALAMRNPAIAADFYRRSVRLARELAVWRPLVHCVAGLAAVAAEEGDAQRAGRLWGAHEALEREIGWRIFPHERAQYDHAITTCVDAAPFAFQSAADRGRKMSLSEIVEYVLDEGSAPSGRLVTASALDQ